MYCDRLSIQVPKYTSKYIEKVTRATLHVDGECLLEHEYSEDGSSRHRQNQGGAVQNNPGSVV